MSAAANLTHHDLSALHDLFVAWSGATPTQRLSIAANGSNRYYERISASDHSCIASLNYDVRENEAFFYYSTFFRSKGLPVPELYSVADNHQLYLQQDLGDTTLYSYIYDRRRQGLGFDAEVLSLYKQVLSDLVRFQTATDGLDFSKAYPRPDFDRQSMQWDLNYFKYYFLKLAHVDFDEQLLENDFQHLIDFLLADPKQLHFFMYRDFQSRNIMMFNNKLYYIDYQGGRRGPAQYDVASLLYSAKSDIPEAVRQELLRHYFDLIAPHLACRGIAKEAFAERFYPLVLLRIMQAMGAYGYRGYFERKPHFLKSIPLAIANLRLVLDNHPLPIQLPQLQKVWQAIINSPLAHDKTSSAPAERLTVTVNSFSYRVGIPDDPTDNGGGHVFDCRALPNPGRYPQYRNFTGQDAPVVEFLSQQPEVEQFLSNVEKIVLQSVLKYSERHFSHLMVSFGCTGGQHRSVYCAEHIANYLRQNTECFVNLHHTQQENKNISTNIQ